VFLYINTLEQLEINQLETLESPIHNHQSNLSKP
jgi:hypothetical protein